VTSLVDLLFGCVHSDYTWPQKDGRKAYVCCLECGKEFAYCMTTFKVLGPRNIAPRDEPVLVERLIASVSKIQDKV
jgi:hypothetical protein